MNRRHDIDALRALAFGLVILYHVGMYYVAGWHWHVKSPHAAEWLQWPMRAVNLWRMDLVFLISGLALGFVGCGSTRAGLWRQRSLRLLVPLAFGMAVVVPYQAYAQALANGAAAPGFGAFLLRYYSGGPWPRNAFDGSDFGVTWNHLWYLPYLWFYTSVLLLILPLLASRVGLQVRSMFLALRGLRLALLPMLPLVLYSVALWPHFPPTHDLIGDGWLHAVYFTLFLYGYWIGVDEGWWAEATRLRWKTLAAAAVMLVVVLGLRALGERGLPARLAGDVYLWLALLTILGWAHLKLNRPWRWLPWAQESVYPWYVLHQTVIIALAVGLAPMKLGGWVEPAVLLAGTFATCWGITQVVRRTRWLRPLFGLKPPAPPRCLSPATPAHPGVHSA